MPTYDYQCPKGHTFELFQRMTDKPAAKCPVCGARAKRVISGGAGLIFKGSGFYITDYGKDGKGPRKAETGADAPAPAADAGAAPKPAEAPKPADSKPADSTAADPKPEKKSKKGSS